MKNTDEAAAKIDHSFNHQMMIQEENNKMAIVENLDSDNNIIFGDKFTSLEEIKFEENQKPQKDLTFENIKDQEVEKKQSPENDDNKLKEENLQNQDSAVSISIITALPSKREIICSLLNEKEIINENDNILKNEILIEKKIENLQEHKECDNFEKKEIANKTSNENLIQVKEEGKLYNNCH